MRRAAKWFWIMLAIPVLLGIYRLKFDTEILNLLPPGNQVVQGLKDYQHFFSTARELVLTVESEDSNLTEEAARSLAEVLRARTTLVEQVTWQPPWLDRPDLSSELVASMWLNQDPAELQNLWERLQPDPAREKLKLTLEELATSLSPNEIARQYDPFSLTQLPESSRMSGVGFGEGGELFGSPDGTFRLLFVLSRPALDDYRACDTWLQQIKSEIAAWRKSGSFEKVVIQYTGRPAFVAEISKGMEKDLAGPSGGTLLIIAVLFYWVHRRWLPLLWMIGLLALVLVTTLAFGGFIFGTLNVVSLGFASILLGLGEDFAIVLYQEAQTHPGASASQIRRLASAGIIWSAITTAGAFILLNFGGLPGLGQLGTLVAIGILFAAFVMLSVYLPPLLKRRSIDPKGGRTEGLPSEDFPASRTRFQGWATLILTVVGIFSLATHRVAFDTSPDALKPRGSVAYQALDRMKVKMKQQREPLWLLFQAGTEEALVRQMAYAHQVLSAAKSSKSIVEFTLPGSLIPNPAAHQSNKPILEKILALQQPLRNLAQQEGFNTNALALTDNFFATWKKGLDSQNTFWPDNANSRWILGKFVARSPDKIVAIGLVYVAERPEEVPAWVSLLPKGVHLSGWELLGPSVNKTVLQRLPFVVGGILVVVLLSLWGAYRNLKDVFLSMGVILFSALLLNLCMSLLGWKWNMLNLTALPLLLGLGIDYAIHMQLALRRYAGHLAQVHASVGKALLLAGSTTIAGFGSLAFSSNAGLASLGQVAGLGIACALVCSIYLLPIWWRTAHKNSLKNLGVAQPSILYRSWFWQIALGLTRRLSERRLVALSQKLALAYYHLFPGRSEIVIENLMPVLNHDREAARRTARELFLQFGRKLAHLWRYECGMDISHHFQELRGARYFDEVRQSKRGILFLTPHLGNWEFGAPILARHGVKLLVITLFEPNPRLTEIRQASRARWGIETLVVGQDPFAFVEVIRRLEDGASVALLVDRPPGNSGVTVELFGQPFQASISPADLARATGCALLPVILPYTGNGYVAEVLPEIPYDRKTLDRSNRARLTQEIMRAFEPHIRQYPEQWYHFVPVWPDKSTPGGSPRSS